MIHNTAFAIGEQSFSRREIRAALNRFQEAERLGYDPDSCTAWRWQCWMLLGEFERAWCESDALIARGAPDPHRLWDGLPFAGKRVIVRCLHGYGDAIQFLRYAPLIRASAERLTVETHPEMVSLVKRISGIDRVITWAGNQPAIADDWDQQIEVMELARACRTSVATIPRRVPYIELNCDTGRRLPEGGYPKIGLVWAASSWNPLRSLSLAQIAPLLRLKNLCFYSFQRGEARGELHQSTWPARIYDTAPHSLEILDTAEDLLEIDLLITVDTMAAHLAGALGRPVWVLLPFEADWRWMLDREDSPWYPTMRLFRQRSRNSGWAPVVNRLVEELSAFNR